MNSRQLVNRDLALAATMGALPGEGDFGADYSEFGTDWTAFGNDFDMSVGAEEAALAVTPAGQSLIAKAKAAVAQANQNAALADSRARILNPNAGSTFKTEKYVMGLTNTAAAPVWGVAGALNYNDTPKVRFRPQRLLINVPMEGIVTITDLSVSNVSVQIGNGPTDGFCFSPLSISSSLDLPTIDPSQRATMLGNWSAFVPPAYVPAVAFILTVSFVGPAVMAGK